MFVLGLLGQSIPGRLEPRAELIRRVDSLDRAIAQLSAAIDSAEPRDPTDTVEVGRFRMILSRGDRGRFVPPAAAISREWESLFATTAPRLYLAVTVSSWTGARTIAVKADSNGAVVGAARLRWTSARLGFREPDVRRALWEAVGGALLERSDSGLRAWLPVAPMGRGDVLDPDDLDYQWVTAFGPASADCRAGSAPRCVAALGLDAPVDREFTLQTRAAVLAYLLETSPPGGWSRLESTAGQPMLARLAAVSGGDPQAAIMAWRQSRLARPRAYWDDPRRWAMAGVWCLVALSVSLAGGMRR
jgi:hypothetical protein